VNRVGLGGARVSPVAAGLGGSSLHLLNFTKLSQLQSKLGEVNDRVWNAGGQGAVDTLVERLHRYTWSMVYRASFSEVW
jgi:hypothetical protein